MLHERVAQALMTKVKHEGLQTCVCYQGWYLVTHVTWVSGTSTNDKSEEWRFKPRACHLHTPAPLPSVVLTSLPSDVMCYKVLPLGTEHRFVDLRSSLVPLAHVTRVTWASGTSHIGYHFHKVSLCRKPFAHPRSSTTRKEHAVFRWSKVTFWRW
jgi:hypothetical protein